MVDKLEKTTCTYWTMKANAKQHINIFIEYLYK